MSSGDCGPSGVFAELLGVLVCMPRLGGEEEEEGSITLDRVLVKSGVYIGGLLTVRFQS